MGTDPNLIEIPGSIFHKLQQSLKQSLRNTDKTAQHRPMKDKHGTTNVMAQHSRYNNC